MDPSLPSAVRSRAVASRGVRPLRRGPGVVVLGHLVQVCWRADGPQRERFEAEPWRARSVLERSLVERRPELARVDRVLAAGGGELVRVARGALDVTSCCEETVDVLALCAWAYEVTGGRFDAFSRAGAGRRADPGPLALAWALERVASWLHADTGLTVVLAAAGQAAVRQPSDPGRAEPVEVDAWCGLAPVSVRFVGDGGVAASGVPQRGQPAGSGSRPPGDVLVAGASLLRAAVHAAVAAVEGRPGLGWLRTVVGADLVLTTPSGACYHLHRDHDRVVETSVAPDVILVAG